MDKNICDAQALLERGNATKEEMEIILKNIVNNYSTRPRIVIFLDDYQHSREEIIEETAKVCNCNCGYEPDFYTCCMDERKEFEELIEDLSDYQIELAEEEDEEEKQYIKERMQDIVNKLEEKFNVDYSYYLDED